MTPVSPSRTELALLTPLRGIAAILVFFFHFRLLYLFELSPWFDTHTSLITLSYLWVDLFFILSGFVMCHVYQNWQPSQTGRFYQARIARIYPLFLISLCVMVGWECLKQTQGLGFYGGPYFGQWGLNGAPAFTSIMTPYTALPSHFLLLQSLSQTAVTWNIAAWSLSAEWLSYLIFPLLLPLLLKVGKQAIWLIPIPLLILAGVANHYGHLDATGNGAGFIRGLAGFSLGMLLYLSQIWRQKWLRHDGLIWICLLLPFALLHIGLMGINQLWIIASFALLVVVSAAQTGRQSRSLSLLDNRLTQHLGNISYSLYLWHAPVGFISMEALHYWAPELLAQWFAVQSIPLLLAGALILLLLMIGIATLSYNYIERSAQRFLLKRWHRQPALSNATNQA